MTDVLAMIISNQDTWDAEFAWSMICMDRSNLMDIGRASGQTISQMRNRAVLIAQRRKASHILMLDADQVYPPDMVGRLLAHEQDVVCGLYPARRSPWYLNIHINLSQDEATGRMSSNRVFNMPVDGLIQADVMGLGGALLKMEIFDKIEYPWFDSPFLVFDEEAKADSGMVGDEFYFAKKCRDAGVVMYCDTTLRYVHLAQMGLVYDSNQGVKYVTPRQ